MLKALSGDESGNAPFAFLEKLNDSQVLYLIKPEETRIAPLARRLDFSAINIPSISQGKKLATNRPQ